MRVDNNTQNRILKNMAKYGHTFLWDENKGEGLIKVLHPIHDNILKFYLKITPVATTIEELETNVISAMPVAKQKMLTPELKGEMLETEVSVISKHSGMVALFKSNPETVGEFADLLGDDPNTAFVLFTEKYGI